MSFSRTSRIAKRAKRGFKGYPVATVALYGPDPKLATKVAVAIIEVPEGEPVALERWTDRGRDVRKSQEVLDQIMTFIERYESKSVVLTDRVIGCPHEEGTDYPVGEVCSECAYWADRERFTGKRRDA